MAENGSELRSIAWSQAFPFVRLFKTLRLSLGVQRLLLALACVLLCYIGGRILDAIWGTRNGVVALRQAGGLQTEVQVYAQNTHGEFRNWLREARGAADRTAILALRQTREAANDEEARRLLAGKSLRSIMIDSEFESRLQDLNQRVHSLLKTGLADIESDKNLSAVERSQKRQELIDAADTVRCLLADSRQGPDATGVGGQKSIELIAAVDPAAKAKNQAELTEATARQALVREY
jgi:hypothetical protein